MNYFTSFKQNIFTLQKFLIILLFILLGSYFVISKFRYQIENIIFINQTVINKKVLLLNKSDPQCLTYNFKPIDPNVTYTSLPIYDFIIFNNEFDILEIRLHELYNYVTLFLIAESRETFSGNEKPFYLKENWLNFTKYHNKIRRIEVKLDRKVTDQWSNEHRMRNEGLHLALSTITDSKYLLLTSDADEIPKARFMNALSHCQLPNPFRSLVLHCDFYYYSYEFRSKPHKWYGPVINLIILNQTNIPTGLSIRKERLNYQIMHSACFHCSWCFNQLKEVRSKMESYSHTEHNQQKFRTREHILNHYRYGKDLFDRTGEEYIYIYNNTEYPEIVKLQPERFIYLTGRSRLPNVGFIDA